MPVIQGKMTICAGECNTYDELIFNDYDRYSVYQSQNEFACEKSYVNYIK